MKKRLIAFGMMVVLIMCLSMTTMAAGTITADEKGVYDHFKAVQGAFVKPNGPLTQKTESANLAKAEQVLTDLDFSADACKDLNKIIDAWNAELQKTPNKTKEDLQAKNKALVDIAVNTKSDYFTVSASLNEKGVGSVTITMKDKPSGGGSDSGSGDSSSTTIPVGQGIINQTGVDTTATVAVFGGIALISLLGVGAFVASRNKKVAR